MTPIKKLTPIVNIPVTKHLMQNMNNHGHSTNKPIHPVIVTFSKCFLYPKVVERNVTGRLVVGFHPVTLLFSLQKSPNRYLFVIFLTPMTCFLQTLGNRPVRWLPTRYTTVIYYKIPKRRSHGELILKPIHYILILHLTCSRYSLHADCGGTRYPTVIRLPSHPVLLSQSY